MNKIIRLGICRLNRPIRSDWGEYHKPNATFRPLNWQLCVLQQMSPIQFHCHFQLTNRFCLESHSPIHDHIGPHISLDVQSTNLVFTCDFYMLFPAWLPTIFRLLTTYNLNHGELCKLCCCCWAVLYQQICAPCGRGLLHPSKRPGLVWDFRRQALLDLMSTIPREVSGLNQPMFPGIPLWPQCDFLLSDYQKEGMSADAKVHGW